MTTQTMFTTLGAALLLVVVAFAVYAMQIPGVPNTGSDGSATPAYVESVSTATKKSIESDENADLNDNDLKDPAPSAHGQ